MKTTKKTNVRAKSDRYLSTNKNVVKVVGPGEDYALCGVTFAARLCLLSGPPPFLEYYFTLTIHVIQAIHFNGYLCLAIRHGDDNGAASALFGIRPTYSAGRRTPCACPPGRNTADKCCREISASLICEKHRPKSAPYAPNIQISNSWVTVRRNVNVSTPMIVGVSWSSNP